MSHHTLTYRANGEVTVIRISGDRDPGEICAEVQKRLFDISPETMRKYELHALAVLAKVAQ